MGEFLAWIVGWSLVMEFLIGYICSTFSLRGYLMEFIKGFSKISAGMALQSTCLAYSGLYYSLSQPCKRRAKSGFNHPSHRCNSNLFQLARVLFTIIVYVILIKGIKESAAMTGVLVFIKLGVIALL